MKVSSGKKLVCVAATPKQCNGIKCSGIDVSLRQSCLHELCGGNGNYARRPEKDGRSLLDPFSGEGES